MTTDLPAGRDLDRFVAEKVFGRGVDRWTGGDWHMFVEVDAPKGKAIGRVEIPAYSTDHNASAEVLAWIREQCTKAWEQDNGEAPMRMFKTLRDLSISEGGRSGTANGAITWLMVSADLPLTWCRVALALAEERA